MLYDSIFDHLVGSQPASSPIWMVAAIVLSLAVLTKAGSSFTDGALGIADHLRLPPVVVGATLVSFATTLPELAVSWTAAAAGSPDVALGNILGSCTCNLGLVLGASALLYAWLRRRRGADAGADVTISFSSVRLPWLLTVAATAFLWASGLWGWAVLDTETITPIESAVLLGFAPLYFGYCLWTRNGGAAGPSAAASEPGSGMTRSIAMFAISTVFVLLAARVLFVNSVELARLLGVSEMVIGLTIVAVGTSLPELVCSLSAVIKGHADLSVGNILGANLINLSAGIGFAAAVGPVSIHESAMAFYVPGVLVLTLLLGLLVRRDHRLSGRSGVILLATYVTFLLVSLRIEVV